VSPKLVKSLRHHPSLCSGAATMNSNGIWATRLRERDGRHSTASPFIGHSDEKCAKSAIRADLLVVQSLGRDHPNCEEAGDRHAWNVTLIGGVGESKADFRGYRSDKGKFISEYGMMSLPNVATIRQYMDGEPLVQTMRHSNFTITG